MLFLAARVLWLKRTPWKDEELRELDGSADGGCHLAAQDVRTRSRHVDTSKLFVTKLLISAASL